MGKADKRGKKTQPKQAQPQSGDGASPAPSSAPAAASGAPVPLILQLASPDELERHMALMSLAYGVLEEEGALAIVLAQGIVPMSVRLLSDSAQPVRWEAAGLIRNLLRAGGEEVGAALLGENVLPPVVALFRDILEMIRSGQRSAGEEGEEEDCMPGLEHCIHIIWELCEMDGRVLEILQGEGCIEQILQCMNLDVFPLPVCTAAAQCLLTVSDDNDYVQGLISQDSAALTALLALSQREGATGHDALLRVVMSAILLPLVINLPPSPILPEGTTSVLLETLLAVVDEASKDVLEAFVTQLPKAATDKDTPEKAQLESSMAMMQAQRIGLETLANFFSINDEATDEAWEDLEEEEVAEPEGAPASDVSPQQQQLAGVAAQYGVLGRILARTHPLDLGIQQLYLGQGPAGKRVLSKYNELQVRALGSIRNLLHIQDFSQLDPAQANIMWSSLVGLLGSPPALAESDLFEHATGAVWSLLRGLVATGQVALEVTEQHIHLLLQLLATSESEDTKVNAIGVLGILGQMPTVHPHLREIGEALLRVVQDGQQLWASAEALNSIFDVFAEAHANEAFVQLGMLPQLQAILAGLKSIISSRKHSLERDLYERLDETKLNLSRFIKYKAAQF